MVHIFYFQCTWHGLCAKLLEVRALLFRSNWHSVLLHLMSQGHWGRLVGCCDLFLFIVMRTLFAYLCLPPLGLGDILFFPRASVCLSICLSVCQTRVTALLLENWSSYPHETSYKYQSTLDDMQSARTITLAFILFELFPLDCHKILSTL